MRISVQHNIDSVMANLSKGRDRSEIARDALHAWAELKIHEASLIDSRLRREGLRGIAGGAAGSMRDSQGGAGSAGLNQPYLAPKGVA